MAPDLSRNIQRTGNIQFLATAGGLSPGCSPALPGIYNDLTHNDLGERAVALNTPWCEPPATAA